MDGTTALTRQLDRLMAEVGEPADLARPLDELIRSLTAAIPSYFGLVVHLERHGHTMAISAFEDRNEQPVTSLHWVTAPGRGNEETSLTLYAHQAGAFVDLAADLGYALDGSPHLHDRRRHEHLVRLDQDLPPPTQVSGITGTEELATINRAAGVLIERGTHPQQVMTELARQAAAAGLDHHMYARTVLGHVVDPPTT